MRAPACAPPRAGPCDNPGAPSRISTHPESDTFDAVARLGLTGFDSDSDFDSASRGKSSAEYGWYGATTASEGDGRGATPVVPTRLKSVLYHVTAFVRGSAAESADSGVGAAGAVARTICGCGGTDIGSAGACGMGTEGVDGSANVDTVATRPTVQSISTTIIARNGRLAAIAPITTHQCALRETRARSCPSQPRLSGGSQCRGELPAPSQRRR